MCVIFCSLAIPGFSHHDQKNKSYINLSYGGVPAMCLNDCKNRKKKLLVFTLMQHVGLYPRQFTGNSYNESHLLSSRFQILSDFHVLFYSQMKIHIFPSS